MKKYLWAAKSLMIGFALIALIVISSNGFAGEIYAQLSSGRAQLSSPESKRVEMESIDANSGFDVTSNSVTIINSGVYFIMVEGQAGTVTQNQSQAGGYLKLWIEKNRNIVRNSVSEKYVGAEASAGTFVTQSVLPLKKGDAISVGFLSNKPGAGLVITSGEPRATSIGFTIFKIAP